MASRWHAKPNKNLRENARSVVPMLIDDLRAHNNRVVGHPRLKRELHRMRLSGKTLRYAMEVFEPAFGEDFGSCLTEVKRLLDAMGKIHDHDVNTQKLHAHLREMGLFNRATTNTDIRISTSAILKLIHEQFALRRSLFEEMSAVIGHWNDENFKGKVLQSMMIPL
jgi:CHAD domain-containing protein